MKACARCKSIKSLESFNKNTQQKDGHHVYCKSCLKVYHDKYYDEHREEILGRERQRRASDSDGRRLYNQEYRTKFAKEISEQRRLKRYGITADAWDSLFESQGKVCAICRTIDSGIRGWQTDHDHKTKLVRGILCSSCNNGLGRFKDNISSLLRAIEYLRK